MPKRSIYLQPPDNPYRRIQRDLEFLCNYWDRLLATNQNCDIRLPELLRANHLMRHLSSLPLNHRLRVNVNFTILDDSDRLEPQDIYTEMNNVSPFCTESRNGFCRSPCHANMTRYNNLLRNYIRQMNENYAAIERELIRARISTSLVERDRFMGCQNAFYNQRATTYNWNKFPVGNQTCSTRIPSEIREKYVNSQKNNNRPACASFQHECCFADKNPGCSVNQQPARQKENSPKVINQ
ncbi:uncharacterized protein [Anoplolepis gracilipes]|uniref:uncharacterized protein n=1 Tax=Anoplolepis gracilipes TaxID=354296 RepID=UPI003B9F79F1